MIIGSWKAVKDVPVRMENKSFILPSGAIIAVIDMDGESKKILAEVGPLYTYWFDITILNDFEYCF
ncbi:MAG: hypothetical protein WC069_06970 [Candidatus Shapirobacteria bacterium]